MTRHDYRVSKLTLTSLCVSARFAVDDNLADLQLEVLQGSVVVAVGKPPAGLQASLFKPFGSAGLVAVTTKQLLFNILSNQCTAVDQVRNTSCEPAPHTLPLTHATMQHMTCVRACQSHRSQTAACACVSAQPLARVLKLLLTVAL